MPKIATVQLLIVVGNGFSSQYPFIFSHIEDGDVLEQDVVSKVKAGVNNDGAHTTAYLKWPISSDDNLHADTVESHALSTFALWFRYVNGIMSLIATTKWEYYVANVAGILAILGLLIWSVVQSVSASGINYASIFFWAGMILLIALPFTIISFFSSMKGVEVTAKGLIISYVFQKHQNQIRFADIAELKTNSVKLSNAKSRAFRDTFKIILTDGRTFEFDRAQLRNYDKLKATCVKRVKN
jgi:hypothetical protein